MIITLIASHHKSTPVSAVYECAVISLDRNQNHTNVTSWTCAAYTPPRRHTTVVKVVLFMIMSLTQPKLSVFRGGIIKTCSGSVLRCGLLDTAHTLRTRDALQLKSHFVSNSQAMR